MAKVDKYPMLYVSYILKYINQLNNCAINSRYRFPSQKEKLQSQKL